MNICYFAACPVYHSNTSRHMQKLTRTHGSATLSSVQLTASLAPLAVLLPLATVFVLTLQWQCLVTGSHIYMYSSTWLLPWPHSRSRVSCSIGWTSAIIYMIDRESQNLVGNSWFEFCYGNTIPKFLFVSKKTFTLLVWVEFVGIISNYKQITITNSLQHSWNILFPFLDCYIGI